MIALNKTIKDRVLIVIISKNGEIKESTKKKIIDHLENCQNSFKEIFSAEEEYEANQEAEGRENLKAADDLKSKGEQETLRKWFDENEERKRKLY